MLAAALAFLGTGSAIVAMVLLLQLTQPLPPLPRPSGVRILALPPRPTAAPHVLRSMPPRGPVRLYRDWVSSPCTGPLRPPQCPTVVTGMGMMP